MLVGHVDLDYEDGRLAPGWSGRDDDCFRVVGGKSNLEKKRHLCGLGPYRLQAFLVEPGRDLASHFLVLARPLGHQTATGDAPQSNIRSAPKERSARRT